jgi:hypothetical protein
LGTVRDQSGGYGTLAGGATFDFGKALSIAKYFPETREYRISWKGRHFQSPTVTVSFAKTDEAVDIAR